MQARKLDVAIATFPYGGNGGVSSEVPTVRDWLIRTAIEAGRDERIHRFDIKNFSDTPITMTRSAAVKWARENRYDVLLMIDSDMAPDCETGDPQAKPFWSTSFDFLYGHFDKGPVAICAPYCGGPPDECVYVFQWANRETGHPNPDWQMKMIDRRHAEILGGIQQVDAQPTGLILYDLRLFDNLPYPWFDYEYKGDGAACDHCGQRKPGPRAEKASTEDVASTRNIAMHAQRLLGYNPLYCNWDAWAGHWKPKLVRKPRSPKLESIEGGYRHAVQQGHKAGAQLIHVGNELPADAPPMPNLSLKELRYGMSNRQCRSAKEAELQPSANGEH